MIAKQIISFKGNRLKFDKNYSSIENKEKQVYSINVCSVSVYDIYNKMIF